MNQQLRNIQEKTKKWLLTNLSPNFYDFGDEKVMTMDDLQKASQDRQTYLAGVKKRAEEYKGSKKLMVELQQLMLIQHQLLHQFQ